MSIPELNAEQVQAMRDMVFLTGAFSQVVPEESKDGENYNLYMEKTRDTEQLVILGLIKEITNECSVKLAETFAHTGRLFRVFELTETGRLLFSDIETRSIN